MNAVFADPQFYLALVSRDDASHARAVRSSRDLTRSVVTTGWVLTEVVDALAAPVQRPVFLRLWEQLRADRTVTIVAPTEDLLLRGIDLFSRRPDKAWSRTDCISFVVMQEFGLSDALTADRHFEQAGFTVLLK